MALELVPLCTASITLAAPFLLPATPAGTRVIAEVADATVDGERLRGRLKGRAAADWATLSDGGVLTLDVRVLMETHDGALVYIHYLGRSDFSQGPGARPIYAAPLFDTGDERYAWLNTIQAVAKGTLSADTTHLEYEMAELR